MFQIAYFCQYIQCGALSQHYAHCIFLLVQFDFTLEKLK